MLKGNHDYWWNSIKKLDEYIKEKQFKNIEFLHNNSYVVENIMIAGTRGWNLTSEEEDEKIINRELIRLELSINEGMKKFGSGREIVVCMHFPPTNKELLEKSKFIEIMQKYNVKKCIYGHLHGEVKKECVEGNIGGIELKLISADYLDFRLHKIA